MVCGLIGHFSHRGGVYKKRHASRQLVVRMLPGVRASEALTLREVARRILQTHTPNTDSGAGLQITALEVCMTLWRSGTVDMLSLICVGFLTPGVFGLLSEAQPHKNTEKGSRRRRLACRARMGRLPNVYDIRYHRISHLKALGREHDR
jgi:hypothetical protein